MTNDLQINKPDYPFDNSLKLSLKIKLELEPFTLVLEKWILPSCGLKIV